MNMPVLVMDVIGRQSIGWFFAKLPSRPPVKLSDFGQIS
ncbi:Mobile element protein [Caenorhabditis elegans]|uniref:Mobile element protein n=1 Tax=Caenorhabditis elegans TaxID=6239 RepID=G3MU73_CAEEL|nr:Mobile element protein [Caenorhabditis elegans]CCD31105.2 Mobile element protein [Caenorhabditis elegans]